MHLRLYPLPQLFMVAILALIWGGFQARAEEVGDAPKGTLIEAENGLPKSTCTVVEDETASGGKAVTSDKDYEPIFTHAAPTEFGEDGKVTIWVRYKGGPLNLKASIDGKQKELGWLWGKPKEYQWAKFGRFGKGELGTELTIIRGNKEQPTLDTVVFATDAKAKPGKAAVAGEQEAATPPEPDNAQNQTAKGETLPPFEPDAKAPAGSVLIAVNWDQPIGPITARHWGVNDYEILKPAKAGDPEFLAFLQSIKPGLIRIHDANLADDWSDEAAKGWNVEKIKAGFAAIKPGHGDAQLMLNIPRMPKWFAATLAEGDDRDAKAAQLIGELARIIRDEAGVKITYWEVLNEQEAGYEKREALGDYWKLINAIATEIKRVDPTAKVGGPALTWAKPQWVHGYLETCGQNVDFISYHNYGIGKPTEGNDKVFAAIDTIEKHARFVRDAVRVHGLEDRLEIFCTEFNVEWTWTPFERRHANNIGALFQASVVKRLAEAGLSGMAVWHVKGNAYGLIDDKDTLRASGQLYRWGGSYLTGAMMRTTSLNDQVELLAVQRADGARSLLVLNRADHAMALSAPGPLLGDAPEGQAWRVLRITAAGGEVAAIASTTKILQAPGYSMTIVTNAPETVWDKEGWVHGPELKIKF